MLWALLQTPGSPTRPKWETSSSVFIDLAASSRALSVLRLNTLAATKYSSPITGDGVPGSSARGCWSHRFPNFASTESSVHLLW